MYIPYKKPITCIDTLLTFLQKRGLEVLEIRISIQNIIYNKRESFTYTVDGFRNNFVFNFIESDNQQDVIYLEYLRLNNYAINQSYLNQFNVFIEDVFLRDVRFLETKYFNNFSNVKIQIEIDRYKRLINALINNYLDCFLTYYNDKIAFDLLGDSYVDSFYVDRLYVKPQVN